MNDPSHSTYLSPPVRAMRKEMVSLRAAVKRLQKRVKALENRPPQIIRYSTSYNP